MILSDKAIQEILDKAVPASEYGVYPSYFEVETINPEIIAWFEAMHRELHEKVKNFSVLKNNFGGLMGIIPVDYNLVKDVVVFSADYWLENSMGSSWTFKRMDVSFIQEQVDLEVAKGNVPLFIPTAFLPARLKETIKIPGLRKMYFIKKDLNDANNCK
jgi:hypothetical protein